jgi:GNAT superfamily N-acetyltransferase
MQIRRGTIKDLPGLLAVDQIACTNAGRRRWLRAAILNRCVYVLTREGLIAGYGVLTKSFFQRPFIEMLLVAEEERRKGCGDALLARLESVASRAGEVWTSTNRSNKPMRRLLRKRGFVFCGRVSGLDAGDPELFYVKKKLR